jgi:hypothetical protein
MGRNPYLSGFEQTFFKQNPVESIGAAVAGINSDNF